MTKFERIKNQLNKNWGFDLWKNSKEKGIPHMESSWTTGYTVSGKLSSRFWNRHNTLKEVEKYYEL